ncbi:MAG TPA: lipoyl(octanoyl) transferase LipB [Candidatus Cybelea sp.]|nr:lipoyl(octanoyl) transferase LipB [Candidatus Cybelea sp.]
MTANARILDLGLRPYREVWELQRRTREAVREGLEPDTWIIVEHEPVITLGRQAKRENLLLSQEQLAAQGVDVVEVERGGDVTYHGPGQLVVYPIRRLARFREVVPFVRSLESAAIACCARFGVAGERWGDHAGVWVGGKCICAIGLAVRRMVSMHGLALNVSTALDYDRLINPCGLTERGITSLFAEAGREVSMHEARTALVDELSRAFDVTLVEERQVA